MQWTMGSMCSTLMNRVWRHSRHQRQQHSGGLRLPSSPLGPSTELQLDIGNVTLICKALAGRRINIMQSNIMHERKDLWVTESLMCLSGMRR